MQRVTFDASEILDYYAEAERDPEFMRYVLRHDREYITTGVGGPPHVIKLVFGGSATRSVVVVDHRARLVKTLLYGRTPLVHPIPSAIIEALGYLPMLQNYIVDGAGPVGEVAAAIRDFDVEAPVFGVLDENDQLVFERYQYRALLGPEDLIFWHATRSSNMRSIKQRDGLLPSGELRRQGEGWTQFNLNLQRAVYITANLEYAQAIAQTLADRYEETAVVLQVSGRALKDTRRIVPDEDVFRNPVDGSILYGAWDARFPAYLEALASSIASIGYMGRIPLQYVRLVQRVHPSWSEQYDD